MTNNFDPVLLRQMRARKQEREWEKEQELERRRDAAQRRDKTSNQEQNDANTTRERARQFTDGLDASF